MPQRYATTSPLSDESLEHYEDHDFDASVDRPVRDRVAQIESPTDTDVPRQWMSSPKCKAGSFKAINNDPSHIFDPAIERYLDQEDNAALTVGSVEDGLTQNVEKEEEEDQTASSEFAQDNTDDVEALLEEAVEMYSDEKPPFCIVYPGKMTRTVRLLGSVSSTVLVFRFWEQKRLGYWLFTDINGICYIVKHKIKGYHVWLGVARKFSCEPIAYAYRKGNQYRYSVDTEGHEAVTNTTPVRTFRVRTLRQEKPYSTYNVQRKLQDRGDDPTDAVLERAVAESKFHSKTCKTEAAVRVRPRKREFSNASTTDSSLASQSIRSDTTQLPSTLSLPGHLLTASDIVVDQVVFRTRLDTVGGPSVAFYLRGIESSKDLFTKLEEKWCFMLASKPLSYCIAHFDWLDKDKSILMQTTDQDAFHLLVDEIGRAPAWQRGEQIDVDLELHTGFELPEA